MDVWDREFWSAYRDQEQFKSVQMVMMPYSELLHSDLSGEERHDYPTKPISQFQEKGIAVMTEALTNPSSDESVLSCTPQSKFSSYSPKYALGNRRALMNLGCISEILSQLCLSKERINTSFINLSSSWVHVGLKHLGLRVFLLPFLNTIKNKDKTQLLLCYFAPLSLT